MILYMMALAALILLILLYRYLPNKKIFACFCLTLAAAGLIVYYVWPRPEPPKTALSESEQWERSQQQQIFAAWYAGYQKDLNELDRNWQWYHHILENFKENNISIQTTYQRDHIHNPHRSQRHRSHNRRTSYHKQNIENVGTKDIAKRQLVLMFSRRHHT